MAEFVRSSDTKAIAIPVEAHERLKRIALYTGRTMAGCVNVFLRHWETTALARMSEEERRRYWDGTMPPDEARSIHFRHRDAVAAGADAGAAEDDSGPDDPPSSGPADDVETVPVDHNPFAAFMPAA